MRARFRSSETQRAPEWRPWASIPAMASSRPTRVGCVWRVGCRTGQRSAWDEATTHLFAHRPQRAVTTSREIPFNPLDALLSQIGRGALYAGVPATSIWCHGPRVGRLGHRERARANPSSTACSPQSQSMAAAQRVNGRGCGSGRDHRSLGTREELANRQGRSPRWGTLSKIGGCVGTAGDGARWVPTSSRAS